MSHAEFSMNHSPRVHIWPSVSPHRKMCHWRKWKTTNELTVTPVHLPTPAFSFAAAYLIKSEQRSCLTRNRWFIFIHSREAASRPAPTWALPERHMSFCPSGDNSTTSKKSGCMWCVMGREKTTDLCRWGCSRLSILSRFCFSGCSTVKGRAQLGFCQGLVGDEIGCEHTWRVAVLWGSECHPGCWRWLRQRCTGPQCGSWRWRSTGRCCCWSDWPPRHWSSSLQCCRTLRGSNNR